MAGLNLYSKCIGLIYCGLRLRHFRRDRCQKKTGDFGYYQNTACVLRQRSYPFCSGGSRHLLQSLCVYSNKRYLHGGDSQSTHTDSGRQSRRCNFSRRSFSGGKLHRGHLCIGCGQKRWLEFYADFPRLLRQMDAVLHFLRL